MTVQKQQLDKFIPYGAHYIDADDEQAVVASLRTNALTCGPLVDAFEAEVSKLVQSKYVASCSNGTAGLHIACLALGIKPGDKVIVPTLTFLATANAPWFCGAEIIFADVDPQTALMTPETFQDALNKAGENVKAVFPVHIAGHSCDMEGISKIARAKNIAIIEDACHAFGTIYKGKPVGSCEYSDMVMFSFHPVKNIAMGEGGAITTNNPAYDKALRLVKSHGMIRDTQDPWFYSMPAPGLNYRLTDIQCALGLSQLKKLSMFKEHRQNIRDAYVKAASKYPDFVRMMPVTEGSDACWHLAVALIDFKGLGITRTTMMHDLKAMNIGTQVHYQPVHTQPYYKNIKDERLVGAETYFSQALTLPLHMMITEEQAEIVIETIVAYLKSHRQSHAA